MAEVKWIKLNVGMFDGNSFKRIKKAKIGGESFRDKLTAVWFELMDFAGKCNAGGQLIESPEIPFLSIDDIAVMIDRETDELNLCMQYFISNRMITVIDDIYMLTNWAKYQNEDGLERIREQTRNRVAKHRSVKKITECNTTVTQCNVTRNATVTQCNAIEVDKEVDKNIDTDVDVDAAAGDENQLKQIGGLGKNVVYLSDNQFSSLIDKIGIEAFDRYMERLADYIITKNAYVRNHYETILKWHKEDSAVKEEKER